MMNPKKVVVIPVFNEEKTVLSVLEAFESQADFFILINDGSTDQTGEILDQWSAQRVNSYVILIEDNKGMAFALGKGFRYILELVNKQVLCDEDIVITMDGDGQHSDCDLNVMCQFFLNGQYDLVIAKRDFRHYPRHRIIGNRIMSLYASFLSGMKFYDVESGCRCFRIKSMKKFLKHYIGYQYTCAIEIGLIAARLGLHVNNDWPMKVNFYRKRGPGLKHFFLNMVFGFIISIKFLMIKQDRLL